MGLGCGEMEARDEPGTAWWANLRGDLPDLIQFMRKSSFSRPGLGPGQSPLFHIRRTKLARDPCLVA